MISLDRIVDKFSGAMFRTADIINSPPFTSWQN